MPDRSSVLILATLETKAEEIAFLTARLAEYDVFAVTVDVSLRNSGTALGSMGKLAAMEAAAASALEAVDQAMEAGVNAVVGLGGGTGAEIILKVLRAMPITFPKLLITTLPFDPRYALADNSIVLVPTLADVSGLNATLREVLENSAAMVAGLCRTRRRANACVLDPSIGLTALGATEGAVAPLLKALRARQKEATVFHANGFGGAAFTRFAKRGAFHTIIDLTPHEMTRMEIAGAHVPMKERFSAAADVPRIVLPGGLNFLGLGEAAQVRRRYLERPHYAHTSLFTHVKLNTDEMSQIAKTLAASLNACTGPCRLIVPMGGFSHQDCPGGAIEDADLRGVFLEQMQRHLNSTVRLDVIDAHLFDAEVTDRIVASLTELAPA